MTQLNGGHLEKNGIFPKIWINVIGALDKIMPKTFVDNPWKNTVFVQQITLGWVRDPTDPLLKPYNLFYSNGEDILSGFHDIPQYQACRGE